MNVDSRGLLINLVASSVDFYSIGLIRDSYAGSVLKVALTRVFLSDRSRFNFSIVLFHSKRIIPPLKQVRITSNIACIQTNLDASTCFTRTSARKDRLL